MFIKTENDQSKMTKNDRFGANFKGVINFSGDLFLFCDKNDRFRANFKGVIDFSVDPLCNFLFCDKEIHNHICCC